MKGSSKGAYSDWEMLRAYQDTIKYIEEELAHSVRVHILSTRERGRVVVRLELLPPGGGAATPALAAYQTDWPNAQGTTFAATLYQAAMKLVRLGEDSLRDAEALLRRA